MYLVPKLAECHHMFAGEIVDMTDFPLLKSILEIIHHGDLVSGGIKEDDTKASSHMHHAESHNDIGAGTIANTDAIFDPQLVQNGHQVLAYH